MIDYTTQAEQDNFDTWGEQNRRRNRQMNGIQEPRTLGIITASPPYNDPTWKWGIDIAGVWDGILTASIFKLNGGSFVIVKGLDGTITGKYVYENAFQLQQENVPFALYMWLYPNSKVSCAAQGLAASQLAKQLKPKKVFWDFEWTSYGGVPANPGGGDLSIAIDTFEQAYGQEAGIYSSLGYVTSGYPIPSRYANRVWWPAQYGVSTPSAVSPFGLNWSIWQQSDRWTPAANWGIDPNWAHVSDGDVMTPEKFEVVFGGETPEPPPNPGGTMQYQVVWANGATVRPQPNTGGVGIRVLAFNQVVDVIQDNIADTSDPANPNKRWVKLTDNNYAASNYPDGTGPQVRMKLVSTPPPSGVTVVGATIRMSDGSTVEMEPKV